MAAYGVEFGGCRAVVGARRNVCVRVVKGRLMVYSGEVGDGCGVLFLVFIMGRYGRFAMMMMMMVLLLMARRRV